MNRIPTVAVLAALATVGGLSFAPVPTLALQHGAYSMEVLVDGRPLDELAARGRTYVEALEGREYAIRLHNRTGRRVAVALSVDGLNTIDARNTSAREARKWILGPHETVTLEGWQTGSATARRFLFTTEHDSYGAWLGEVDDLGLISAAFFREKVPPPPRPQPAAPFTGTRRSEASQRDLAATGIGREVEHRVRQVRFEAESEPAGLLDLRYEYRDALVRLGVLPADDAPLARRERARGFRDSGFAPDPYRQPR